MHHRRGYIFHPLLPGKRLQLSDALRGEVCMKANVSGIVGQPQRSEEHTSELQSLMRISYAVFCLKKKTIIQRAKNDKRRRCNQHLRLINEACTIDDRN